jgi:acyl carrier protein
MASRRNGILSELEDRGAQVRVVQGDVSDRAQMSRVFEQLRQDGVQLNSVFHAAGMITRKRVVETDLRELGEVLLPKVTGAWILHELTRELGLEHFILFSSAASVWGSQELGAYAAANHFLDALAHHRHQLGLPALSINWGPWGGGGMATQENGRLLSLIGVRELPSEQACQVLEQLAAMKVKQLTVADVDWNLFRRIYEARMSRPLLEEMEFADRSVVHSSRTECARRLEEAPLGDRYRLMMTEVVQVVLSVMRLEADDRVDHTKGFFEMGMDSLMAVELAQCLEDRLGRGISTDSVFNHPTVEALSEYILLEILKLEFTSKITSKSLQPDLDTEAILLAKIEKLSESEAEALLRERLADRTVTS